jgi:hypothetical protein
MSYQLQNIKLTESKTFLISMPEHGTVGMRITQPVTATSTPRDAVKQQ